MLFTKNLDQLIFNRHENLPVDRLTILSWYLWPNPIIDLADLPFPSTVIYGMYWSDWISSKLHEALKHIQQEHEQKISILYSNIPVHSKCYLRFNNTWICSALVWSANFSTNGLTTPFREVLTEPKEDWYERLWSYIEYVINNSVSCLDPNIWTRSLIRTWWLIDFNNVSENDNCLLSLLWRWWEIQNAAWLNWWQNPNNHTNLDDAYIPIRIADIKRFPNLFPPKQESPLEFDWQWRRQRNNDYVDIIWDDWTSMKWLLEWSQTIDGIVYPKQVSSFPIKSELWIYMRNRLWVPLWRAVSKEDLLRYWRTDVEVSLISEWVYYFDFSNTN